MRIAVLLTCHNRKEKTCKCLRSLFAIKTDLCCDVYLTDDGSTDGTSDIIRNEFPDVHLIKGDGSLFWNRGMYTSWKEATKYDYDYYLWLNDDVELYPNSIEELLGCSNLLGNMGVVSGLVEDKSHTSILYGGYDEKHNIIEAKGVITPIKYMNGNVVLIPKYVFNIVGYLDPLYHHDLGDVDYGLRSIENGLRVVSTRIPIAMGNKDRYCRVRKWNSNLIGRFKKLYSPLGSIPYINFYYRRKHFGLINATVYWLYLHVINLMPDRIVVLFFGENYIDK